MPASELVGWITLTVHRFDRYQEADVSDYGKVGTGPYDHFFGEF